MWAGLGFKAERVESGVESEAHEIVWATLWTQGCRRKKSDTYYV